jgi:hypothetical protein
MNTYIDKQTKDYPTLSRYESVAFYYDTLNKKYVYGLCKPLSDNSSYTLHTLTPSDTLDSLALFYYGRPDYYWIIADFNRIIDPFMKLTDKFKTIKIPSISYIYYTGDIYAK